MALRTRINAANAAAGGKPRRIDTAFAEAVGNMLEYLP